MADNFNISDVPESAGPKSVEVPGDIADGTAGELMTWDAAGVAALVATGSATDVLTSNGAGAAPTFQAGGGAPVSSVFGRVGAVVAVSGDYDFTEVSGTISDAQHGTRAGGTLHADVVAGGADGFMTGTDKTKLDGISAGAEVNAVDSVFGRTGAVVAAASDYDASQVDNDSNILGATVDVALNNLDNAALQMIRTTAFTLPTVFGDITLDLIDIETDSAIIDGEAGTPDRVTLEVAGVYEINYHFEVGPSSDTGSGARIEARVRVNDTTVLPGSAQYTTIHDDSSLESQDHVDGLACSFLYDATAADFITLQAQMVILAGTPDPDLLANTVVMTVKRITQPE